MVVGVNFRSDDEIEREDEDKEHQGFAKPGSGIGLDGMTRLETLIKLKKSVLETNKSNVDKAKLYKALGIEIDKIAGA